MASSWIHYSRATPEILRRRPGTHLIQTRERIRTTPRVILILKQAVSAARWFETLAKKPAVTLLDFGNNTELEINLTQKHDQSFYSKHSEFRQVWWTVYWLNFQIMGLQSSSVPASTLRQSLLRGTWKVDLCKMNRVLRRDHGNFDYSLTTTLYAVQHMGDEMYFTGVFDHKPNLASSWPRN